MKGNKSYFPINKPKRPGGHHEYEHRYRCHRYCCRGCRHDWNGRPLQEQQQEHRQAYAQDFGKSGRDEG